MKQPQIKSSKITCMHRIGLTEKRKIEGIDQYIFPEDVYSVTGFHCFTDNAVLTDYAAAFLENYKNSSIQLYLNGGLTLEVAAVLIAASRLAITISCMHLNRDTGHYAEQKVRWNPYDGKNQGIEYSLCAGRHPNMPDALVEKVEGDKVLDFAWQESQIRAKLQENHIECGGCLNIYVTGLTALLISALNVASDYQLKVICMHYDISSGDYIPQEMY